MIIVMRLDFGLLLQLGGHEIHKAVDGAGAGGRGPRATRSALLDIGMLRMDGYEVARRIRSQPKPHGNAGCLEWLGPERIASAHVRPGSTVTASSR